MTPSNKILLTDRTSIDTDWFCGMKYWWYKLEGGKGIVPKVESDFFAQGKDIHADLHEIALGRSVSEVIAGSPPPEPPTQMEMEIWQRRRGWVAGYARWFEEDTKRLYDTDHQHTEEEIVLQRDPLWVATTPDRLLPLRSTGALVYRDYKSTGSTSIGWTLHWTKAVQVHIGLIAAEEEYGKKVAYGQILGLYKGREAYGRLNHPYVWAYFKGGEWSSSYKAGWEHRPVWEYEGGIEEWVERLGYEAAAKVFIWSQPIYADRRLVEDLVSTRIRRMEEIEQFKEAARTDLNVRKAHFEQRFSNCIQYNGQECPFLAACWNKSVQDDPLGSGLYVPRTPHHDLEIIGVGEDDGD